MNEALYDLIARVLSGEATAQEAAALRQQCAADVNVQKAFEAGERVWNTDLAFPHYNTEAAWQKVSARLALAAPPAQRRTLAFPTWTRWAAAATVIGLGTTFALLWKGGSLGTETPTQLVAATQMQVVTLNDGSQITLQKGAKLAFSPAFGEGATREVTLEGVAFFNVAKDAAHPFVVKGETFSVKVLGTSFSVDENADRVVVETGRVEVVAGNKKVVLTGGETADLKGGSLQKAEADLNSIYWKTGTLVFTDKSFSTVIEEISRILEVPVQFDASVLTADRVQSVNFTSQSSTIEPVLTDLCKITGTRWVKDGSAYRILRAR
jgi:ferric-dicitrate binding protein FerR (iron transport regulator)